MTTVIASSSIRCNAMRRFALNLHSMHRILTLPTNSWDGQKKKRRACSPHEIGRIRSFTHVPHSFSTFFSLLQLHMHADLLSYLALKRYNDAVTGSQTSVARAQCVRSFQQSGSSSCSSHLSGNAKSGPIAAIDDERISQCGSHHRPFHVS